jgi:hypothetical protein
MVLEPSEFELSKFDCIYIQYVDGVNRIWFHGFSLELTDIYVYTSLL